MNTLITIGLLPVIRTFARRGLCLLLLAGFSPAAFGVEPPVPNGCSSYNTNPANSAAGVQFLVIGALPSPAVPMPTIFVFGADKELTITKKSFVHAARDYLRAEHGYLVVSIDMPAHGADLRPGETAGLAGWRSRLAANENVVSYFTARATAVLNYLVANEYTDPTRVAAMGISRGGFMAVHWMAANPGVSVIAAVAPVTELLALTEFNGMAPHALTQSLDLTNLAATPNLQHPLWITIGNHDTRVGTDRCITFARAVANAAPAAEPLREVYLHVLPSDDHHQPLDTHPNAAAWIHQNLTLP